MVRARHPPWVRPIGRCYLTGDCLVTYHRRRMMDDVFRALADPTRRELLDELFRRDGQSLGELEEGLPMTRFGVMKHLSVLERAGLIDDPQRRPAEAALPEPRPDPAGPRPVGQQVRRALGGDAQLAQARIGGRNDVPEKVFEIYIRTTPERLWEAITDPRLHARYNFGLEIHSDWGPGSGYSCQSHRRRRSPWGRTSRWLPRDGWCRASPRCGARTCVRRAARG